MTISLAEAHDMIRAHSITWYEPVIQLPPRLNEAASSAYLCMRAVDEIEDHPKLDRPAKLALLRGVSDTLQTNFTSSDFRNLFNGYEAALDEVTLRLDEWARLAPREIAPRVLDTFATLADRLATWAERGWRMHTGRDLDQFTYAAASGLALLLSDLWSWYDGTATDRTHAVAYGRALQLVNIMKDRDVDAQRGVDFWPTGWGTADMRRRAEEELRLADEYVAPLPPGPIRNFCEPPLTAARQYVDTLD